MKAKEYLRQVMKLDKMISTRELQCEEIRTRIEGVSAITYDKPSIQSSISGDNINLYDALIGKENEIKAIILDYEQTRDEIVAAIYMLENVQHAVLLEKRYLEYDKDSFREKRFEEIAVEMKYSYDRIVHMHGEALKEMQKLINSNKKKQVSIQ
jgi:hypothetical protein